MMGDQKKTKQELIEELAALRRELAASERQVADLKDAGAERQRMEKALRESEERYRGIVELAPDGIVTTNLAGVVTSCNSAFLELTGYARDEIVGTHALELPTLRVEELAQYARLLFSLLRGKPLAPYEFRWLHKDGTIRWGEAHVSLMKRQGRPSGLQAILRDITARKERERALGESELKFRTLVDQAPEALFLHNMDGQIVDVNQTAVERYGYTRDELLEMEASDIDPDYGEREDRGLVWRQLKASGQTRFEGRHRCSDGTMLPVAVSLSAIELAGARRILALAEDITERKRAQEALRKSEERFRDLVEHSFDLICTHDLQGRLLSVNPAAERITGYTAEELIGTNVGALLIPSVQDQFDDYLAEIEREGEASGLMYVADRSGEQVILEYHNSLRVEGVPVPIVRGTARDITERQRAEEALQEREDRLSKTMLAANDGMWDWDLASDDVYFDPRYYEMVGYEVDEFPHRLEAFQKRVHPDDIDYVMAQAQRHLSGEIDRFKVEFRFRKKSGDWLWIMGRGVIVERDEDGTPLRFVGTHTDIGERKRAEKALAQSKNMFETMLQNMPGGMLLIGEDYRIRQTNVRACDITGYTEEELIGELCDVVCPTGSAAKTCPIWQEGANRFTGIEAAVRCKDGDKRPVLKNAQRITIDGESYILETFQDIAKRKEMEKELRQQERLATVGQLAAGIAHDFRNLLATIILYAQMDLNAPDLPPGLAEHMRIIVEESKKATDLVQQILDFSSRAMIERQPLDLSAFVGQTLEVLRRTIPESVRISLELEPGADGSDLTVFADPGRLQQALTNLALNARDAMPEGGDLRLALSRLALGADETPPVAEMEPGGWVCLAVSDSGTGMTEEVQQHLFEPFFTTKEVGKGTGLGLAQVYGIIRQHDGAIDVETAPGQGAAFRIYLPAEDVEPEEEGAGDGSASSSSRARGETLLLVEDKRALREAAKGILESLGYRVLTAADGRQALDIYQDHGGVDLIITDLVMPNMGGEALMRTLRQRRGQAGRASGVRAVGITGYAMEDVTAELRDAGFVDLIQKPFGGDELAAAVRQALDDDRDR